MAIGREELQAMLDEGLSLRAMAARLGVSYTTVRHWMGRHGLVTPRSRRLAETAPAREAGLEACAAICETHGEVTLIRRGAHGFRCPLCRSEAVSARRRRVKQQLVTEHGGACVRCGYARSVAALHFHHIDPATKSFAVAARGVSRSIEAARAEVANACCCARTATPRLKRRPLPADTSYYERGAARGARFGPG